MTTLINFLGQPSSGKTSLSSELFAEMKKRELNAEYVTEFVKTWAWEEKQVGAFDQYYIFGKESHNQSRLFNKVDYVIADSPVMLTAFYQNYYTGKNLLVEPCKDFYKVAQEEFGVKVLNIFLPRKKKYNPKGRYQTEAEATEVGITLKSWLNEQGYDYIELTCSNRERVNKVLDLLGILNMEIAEDGVLV